jgi:hypothetical protein
MGFAFAARLDQRTSQLARFEARELAGRETL